MSFSDLGRDLGQRSLVRHLSSFSKGFTSEIIWPISSKFRMQPAGKGGKKVCIFGPNYITKMAAMPIYGEKKINKTIFFSRITWPFALKLGMSL